MENHIQIYLNCFGTLTEFQTPSEFFFRDFRKIKRSLKILKYPEASGPSEGNILPFFLTDVEGNWE